jgi:hypothetical protein
MSLKHVWIVFSKEIKDMARDKRTLISNILIPIILMPLVFTLMGGGISKMEKDIEENVTVALSQASDTPEIRDLVADIFSDNPNIKILDPVAELPPEYRGNTSVFTFIISQSPINQFIRDATIYNDWHYRSWMYVNDLLNKHVISPAKYISDVYMGIELYKEYTDLVTKYPEINTVVNDFINRALEGMIDNFNTEWQQYIEQLYSAGLEEIIEKIFNNPEFKDYDPGQKFILRE